MISDGIIYALPLFVINVNITAVTAVATDAVAAVVSASTAVNIAAGTKTS